MVHGHRFLVVAMGIGLLVGALALIAAGGLPAQAQGDVIYVDADAPGPTHDGSSWDFAYTDLQPALADADPGQQIWVATGTYTPTWRFDTVDPRSATFQMVNGVAIYGGFDPTVGDTAWEDRDWEANPTILSGDIGNPGDSSDNSYHVFYHPEGLALDNSAILDGFTITGGNADGSYPHFAGGGMFNLSNSSPTLTNCTFKGNSATQFGGGMVSVGPLPTLTNCTFTGNSASVGGGMYNESSSPTLTSCTFTGNSASVGGGIYNFSSSPTLTNCTFDGNSAGGEGGGIYNTNESAPTLTNCILWGDSPQGIYNADVASTPAITYSDIQGGCDSDPYNRCGDGNIDEAPLFLDPGNGDFHLGPGSPCIDAGTNGAPNLPAHDFEGDPRVLAGDGDETPTVDMGVDEVRVYYVDGDAQGANDGSTWNNAFTNLQPALDAAAAGHEIWVAAGAYKPTEEHGGSGDRYRSFQMVNGLAICGGFDPSVGDTRWNDRDWAANPTILSGDIGDEATDEDNSYHVFYHPSELALNSRAILDGFTITGGNANHPTDTPFRIGGGMVNVLSSPALTNCTFSDNSSDARGGGIYNWTSSPVLTNCSFSHNSAAEGGGMYNLTSSSPQLTNCTFSGNTADTGGGMNNYMMSSPTLTNCTFDGNSAGTNGGGMANGAISSPTLINCTFANNSAADGGGLFNYGNSAPVLTNCILWGDSPPGIHNADNTSTPAISYSDIHGGCDSYPFNLCGSGNIDSDPLFVDPDNGDLHLGAGSPCIDAGTNGAPNLPAHDFEGDPRIRDGDSDGDPVVDMGVDEALWHPVYLPLVLKTY